MLFVTATGTNVGKTYASLQLIKALKSKGLRVGCCKPIETGVVGTPLDAAALLDACRQGNSAFASLTPKDITAYTFALPAAPYCADTDHSIDPAQIMQKIKSLQSMSDFLIVEGAGGLMVPITRDYFMIDLLQDIGCSALLITPSHLGCINETLLSIEALQRRSIPFEWCVNLREDGEMFRQTTQPFYDTYFQNWWSLQDGLEQFVSRVLKKIQ